MKKYVHAFATAGIVGIGVTMELTLTGNVKSPQNDFASGNLGMKVTFGKECFGRTDYPHISTHISNTVNVISETNCPGRSVSVRTTLSRRGWLFFRETAAASKTGLNSVRVSVSMNCKWKIGESPIEYVVESVHREMTGASGVTRLHKYLKC